MTDANQESLSDLVARYQVAVAGKAVAPWLIEAQLQAVDDRLEKEAVDLYRRVGEGRFLAIGTIAAMSLSIALGLLIHPGAILAAAWKLRRLLYFDRDWRPQVVALYVTLDGTDRQVFEAVHWLCMELIVVNFERYEAEDFANAYGTDAPGLQRIIDRLDIEATEVSKSLVRLLRSEVLRSDGSRYWIPL